MSTHGASAIAHPNIALIKYWGNRDHQLRLPSNGSISMTLGNLETRTNVTFDPTLSEDALTINGSSVSGATLTRVTSHLDFIREMAGFSEKATITSDSNFPMGTGIASSASGFAALTLAACTAAGLELSQQELSRISRLGSGSACRSIFGGYVEWFAGEKDQDSFAQPIVDKDYWYLIDLIAIVGEQHKSIGSTSGHKLAETSHLQPARILDVERRLQICKQAILEKDFQTLASIVEEDSNMMHAIMMTSSPPLLYWLPATIAVMHAVVDWRYNGLEVFYTIDAGPNVHCLCTSSSADEISRLLYQISGILKVIRAPVGGDATLI